MRKHRYPGGVKVARFHGISEVSGSIHVSRLCFLLIFVVFTLCLPLVPHPRPRALLIPNINQTSPPALHLRSYNIVHLCVLIVI